MERNQVTHTFGPCFDQQAQILILGTIPSVKSRAQGFYYGHPQNRFWKVLSRVYETAIAATVLERRQFVLSHHIALWDVLASCTICGSSDNSIRDAIPNDIDWLLKQTQIKTILTTGKQAYALYERLCFPSTQIHARCLPSPSPANCACSLDELVVAYRPYLPRYETME